MDILNILFPINMFVLNKEIVHLAKLNTMENASVLMEVLLLNGTQQNVYQKQNVVLVWQLLAVMIILTNVCAPKMQAFKMMCVNVIAALYQIVLVINVFVQLGVDMKMVNVSYVNQDIIAKLAWTYKHAHRVRLEATNHKVVSQNAYYAKQDHILQFKVLQQPMIALNVILEVYPKRVPIHVLNVAIYLILHRLINHIVAIYLIVAT